MILAIVITAFIALIVVLVPLSRKADNMRHERALEHIYEMELDCDIPNPVMPPSMVRERDIARGSIKPGNQWFSSSPPMGSADNPIYGGHFISASYADYSYQAARRMDKAKESKHRSKILYDAIHDNYEIISVHESNAPVAVRQTISGAVFRK